MKILVHTLVHAEVGIVAQLVQVEGQDINVEQMLAEQVGVEFAQQITKDEDYLIDTREHML